MANEKLRKYLAYYQKVLKEDPENIEARLRLAAIFREMGRDSHAVEEYVSASKLLAKEGLPLEAIAACKAVLEIEPTHTEIQFFLARLFAQSPEAAGISSRIAEPVEPMRTSGSNPRIELPPTNNNPVVAEQPITLGRPKAGQTATRRADVLDSTWNKLAEPTQRSAGPDVTPTIEAELGDIPTETEMDEPPEGATREFSPVRRDSGDRPPEFVETVDLDPLEVMASLANRKREMTSVQPRTDEEAGDYIVANEPTELVESIELGVFDMESLGLDDDSREFMIPSDYEELDMTSLTDSSVNLEAQPSMLSVSREGLPEIPLLSQLNAHAFMELLKSMELRKMRAGSIVIDPRIEVRAALYIVVRGAVGVTREVNNQRVELATLREGEFFGEFKLLTGRDGLATVFARTDVDLLEVSEDVINKAAGFDPEIWEVLWHFYYDRMLNNLLASSEIFRPLSETARTALASHFVMKELVTNEVLLHEGEPCEHVYLLLNGEIALERNKDAAVQHLAALRAGEFFGVVSSFREDPYTADVRALRDTTLLCLPAVEFRKVLDAYPEVAAQTQKFVRSRRALDSAFMSGMTEYGELGVAKG